MAETVTTPRHMPFCSSLVSIGHSCDCGYAMQIKEEDTKVKPFSSRKKAASIISLFWPKLGHGMGADSIIVLEDVIRNSLEDAYDAGGEDAKA